MSRQTRASRALFKRVYVVNLDRRPERLAFITEQLEAARVDRSTIVRFSAVEGSSLRPADLHRWGFLSRLGLARVEEPVHAKIWGMDLNAGGLGCAMSHVVLWSRIAAQTVDRRTQQQETGQSEEEEEEDVSIVLEDDSLIPRSFLGDYVERMSHVPRDWQLVYLSGLDTQQRAPYLRVGDGVSRVPQFHRTTNAYAITPAGARSLLEMCLPLTYQLDTQMTMTTATDARTQEAYAITPSHCYTLQPPLIVQATRFGTDIQTGKGDALGEEEAARCAAARWTTPPSGVN